MSCTLVDNRPLAGVQGQEWGVLLAGLGATGLLAGYLSMVLERRSRAELLVEERTRALSQARELDELKNDFVNAVSHELRTPLTTILGYAEFLEDDIGGPLTRRAARASCAQIQRGARRLETLVDDLLDFARIDAGTFQLRAPTVDLATSSRGDRRACARRPTRRGLTLALELPDGAARWARWTPSASGRCSSNLLGNAIKFTPPGGTVTVRARPRGRRAARARSTDTGLGIAPEDMPGCSSASASSTAAGRRAAPGSASHQQGDRRGARRRIGVESERPGGATFWFTLPIEAKLPCAST